MKPIRKRAIRYLVICVAALVLACLGGGYLVYSRQQAIARAEAERMAAEQAAAQAAAEQAAAEAAARAAEEEAARQAALEAERQAAAQAAAEQAAVDAKEKIEYGDVIGTVWVEGTEVNCDLYWGMELPFSGQEPDAALKMAAFCPVITVPFLLGRIRTPSFITSSMPKWGR